MEPAIQYPYVVCQDGIKPVSECPIFEGRVVYEVIRIINGKPLFFMEHMTRLEHSVTLIKKPMIKTEVLVEGLKTLIHINGMQNDNVRLELHFNEQNGPEWSIQSAVGAYPPQALYETGVAVLSIDAERHDPHAKVVNKALVQRVSEIRQSTGVFEVLLRDARGYITEGSRSNCFIISKGTLVGVPEALILKGITRDKIIESARMADIPYDEALLTTEDLYHADAVMLSGTSIDLLPISKIDGHVINSTENPIFIKLLAQYRQLMASSLNSF